jgi:thiol-disulfide isomerase/thioredoxin
MRSLSQLRDLDGAPLHLHGHPVLAIVFASWCTHCHLQLEHLGALRAQFPQVQLIGVSYPPHEEYDDRGSPAALRTYVAEHAPWLRVVAASEELFAQLGRPAKVPTLYGFDRDGQLVKVFDRRTQRPPTRDELATLLRTLSSSSP